MLYYFVPPTNMCKECECLRKMIREVIKRPYNYDKTFIFYSKDYRKIKILYYDIDGLVMAGC
ncbi:IS66 family insertion sequence element accessory protein TnpB [Odoribacter laneus]